MRIYLSFVLCLFVYSCANTSKPDIEEQKASTPDMLEEARIINDQIMTIGGKKDVGLSVQSDTELQQLFSKGYYQSFDFYDQDILFKKDLDFYYENDSIAENAFLMIRDFYNKSNDNFGNNIFFSWESSSQRGFVVKAILSNKSDFYGKPVVEIKLTEDDNRKYQEQ